MINPEVLNYYNINLEFKEICVGLLSSHYPWNANQIIKYKGILDFERIRFNSNNITLSIDDLERLKVHLDWSGLHKIGGIEYNLDFFEKYEDRIDFTNIHLSSNIDWSNQLLDKYQEKWNWERLSSKYITSIPRNIARYGNLYDWNRFSGNTHLNVSDKLIDEYLDKWHWSKLSANSAFKVDEEGIKRYSEKLCWKGLSRNPSMVPFILAYPNKYEWDWYSFVLNPGVILSDKLISFLLLKFQNHITHPYLLRHKVSYSKSILIGAYLNSPNFNLDRWSGEEFEKSISWRNILDRRPELLSSEQISEYLDLKKINKRIPYNLAKMLPLEFIEEHPEILDLHRWSIFRYSGIDQAYVEKYIHENDWCQLAFNTQFDWSLDFLISNLENLSNPYGLGQNKAIYNLLFGEATKKEINNLLDCRLPQK